MAFSIRCPQCGAKLTAKSDQLVGKKLPCPKCKHVFVVQKPEPARAAPAGEEPDEEVYGVADPRVLSRPLPPREARTQGSRARLRNHPCHGLRPGRWLRRRSAEFR